LKLLINRKHLKNILLLVSTYFSFSTAFSQSVSVSTIYFKSNQFSIDPKYKNSLDAVARQLRSDTFSYLKIFGFADTRGPADHNEVLSGKRANAVYAYLAARVKIDTAKLYVTWIGESGEDVAYDLHFPSAHIQKRCVDIWILFIRKPKVK
jgi:hypothetical protein